MEPDILFPTQFTRYIPVYWMYRASNWTNEQADAQFGGLKTGLNVKLIIEIVGISIGGILVVLGIVLTIQYKKQSAKARNNEN